MCPCVTHTHAQSNDLWLQVILQGAVLWCQSQWAAAEGRSEQTKQAQHYLLSYVTLNKHLLWHQSIVFSKNWISVLFIKVQTSSWDELYSAQQP